MIEIGYWLSSEEHGPNDLVRYARRAEEVGFTFAVISDHYHPWIDRQGQSPFAWSVIGGIAYATERLRLGTGVTCPTIRYHPAIIAQAAATAAAMMPGRFFLGLGTGENLNEHILGDRWPPADVRLDMLEEAVAVVRLLWQGGLQNHHGRYFTVENARIYTLPAELPPIMIAASGAQAAELAGRLGDGLISVAPDPDTVDGFEAAGGAGKPRLGQFKVCWARDQDEARRVAATWWPIAGLKGALTTQLPVPTYFEQAASLVTEEDVAREIVSGPDPERYIASIREFADTGYDHVYLHQVGPDQEGFFQFYKRELLPRLRKKSLVYY
ncbi:MAG TPA: LLM class F420-dependent oxidoreductase [Chloroflexi bacterium]|nr:LLM class F420-dependent oxidoreductase [Chloroflexota bacterium]